MKLNFQQRLVWSFLAIFAVFTAGIVVFEQQSAKRYKTEALEERLDAYADEVSQFVRFHGDGASLDSLLLLLPPNLRLTLVERNGRVVYDNTLPDPAAMENHADRPEVAGALSEGSGTYIRTSATNHQPYLYYAKDNGQALVVRVALPYDVRVRSFLKPDNGFLYFVVALLVVGFVFIYRVGRRFGRSVRHLRDFSATLNGHKGTVPSVRFSNDEHGEVARRLQEDFNRIRENEKKIEREREKLLLHIQTSAEGVCFLHPDRTVAFYNGLFLQYFNVLTGNSISAGQQITGEGDFRPVMDFLDDPADETYYEAKVGKHGKEFLLRLNIFEDKSFEIILTDVTAQEKNRRLKQELTGNIAHELRTPVTSIRGFLEIVLNNDIGKEKANEYLQRAYSQVKTLSELISDMSLLTRIDQRSSPAFAVSKVEVNQLIERVRTDTAAALAQKQISFDVDIPQGLTLKGNEGLLYSVFRNLTDNVISHSGENVQIRIRAARVDGVVRFSFADTGKGVGDERHLTRLFERFYRVSEGRTRDTGGSGIGLSIVKNAIQFHGGNITANRLEPHGLEFVFVLPE